mmetsp:Transcript_49886/g.140639  ORF Transcript_49886/g.140639 Transcript_49886/m.140639 type:complete len:99 (-) Transcript_49886:26-322(-)
MVVVVDVVVVVFVAVVFVAVTVVPVVVTVVAVVVVVVTVMVVVLVEVPTTFVHASVPLVVFASTSSDVSHQRQFAASQLQSCRPMHDGLHRQNCIASA